MKKRIYPCGAIMVSARILLVCLIIPCIVAIYYGFLDSQFCYLIPCALLFMCMLFYYLFALCSEKINVYKEKIVIRGDKEQRKMGYDYEISFDDIKELRLILTHKNLDKSEISRQRIKQYLEIELTNGKTKWVCLSYYSKKQQNKIIEIINSKAQLNKSYEDMKNELLQSQFEGRKTFFR